MSERETPGGGTYADGELDDERYWAAAELYITTGKPTYKAEIDRSRFASNGGSDAASVTELQLMNWDHVAGLGMLSLLVAPSALPEGEVATLRRRVSAAAERLRTFIDRRGYRMPLPSDRVYVWGSNVGVLDAGIVLAHELLPDARPAVRARRARLPGLPARPQSAGAELRRRLRRARHAQPAPPRLGAPQERVAARGAARRDRRAAPTR